MIIAASSEKMRYRRRRTEDNPNRSDANGASTASIRTSIIGADPHELKVANQPAPDPDVLHAMAFLVEQGGNSVLNPHFHKTDQFQIFVNGQGSLANHQVTGLAYQFTAANSPYGPIVAGPNGLDYMTLRNNYNAKAYFMPASRDVLRATKRQHREVVGYMEDSPPLEALAALPAVQTTILSPMAEDGLGVWRYTLPPNATVTGPDPGAGTGQFWIVLAGELADETDGAMPRLSSVFVSSEEAPYTARAGAPGLDIMVAQFPMKQAG